MVIKDLKFFPTNKDEITEYVEILLSNTLKTNYEKEKLLLHSLIYLLFCSPIPANEYAPHTILHLLQTTAKEDEDGYSLLDKMYIAGSEKIDNSTVEDIYWYFKDSEFFVDTVIRLISVFQFYDTYFDAPVFSEDKKTLLFYPNHLKAECYEIPEGTEEILSHAFANNPHLHCIKLPKTMRSVGCFGFTVLSSLTGFIVHKDNPHFYSSYGILYKKRPEVTLVKYPAALKNTSFTIPSNVKKILQFAFEDCQNLKEILFESSDTILEDAAFLNCAHIEGISFLDGDTSKFNENAFKGTSLRPQAPNKEEEKYEENFDLDNPEETDDSSDTKNTETNEAPSKDIPDRFIYRSISTTPSKIKTEFDNYIVGHDEAKKTISVAVYSHLLRIKNKTAGIGKSNILMSGPTGVGKTEFARTIAEFLNVPFITVDATSITETGMKGNDPTDMLRDLYFAAGENILKAQNGIIYIDEIDKLATFGENSHRESYSKAVQQGLLKIVEGGKIPVRIESSIQPYTIEFDTSNILFIAGGAFNGLVEQDNPSGNQIGFNKETVNNEQTRKLEAKDYIKYGMTQEFMGRFPVLVRLNALTEDEIYRILLEPKNSIIQQYQSLVKCIGSELVFEEELLRKIAQNAIKTGTGARGLRSVIESLVENIIYELPDKKDVKKVIVHDKMFENEPAKYVLNGSEITFETSKHNPSPAKTEIQPTQTYRT